MRQDDKRNTGGEIVRLFVFSFLVVTLVLVALGLFSYLAGSSLFTAISS